MGSEEEKSGLRPWWVEWSSVDGPRRVALRDRLTVGRGRQMDVVIDDMYVSREHCVLALEGDGVRVDASKSVNRIAVNGRLEDCVLFTSAGSFTIGETTIHLRPAIASDDTTLVLGRPTPALSYRRSTRELFGSDGALIAQFSTQEGAALQAIVASYPDAAATQQISTAVWGEPDYESYLIHRLMQRVRSRMGDNADLIENVRGAGYRLRSPIEMR